MFKIILVGKNKFIRNNLIYFYNQIYMLKKCFFSFSGDMAVGKSNILLRYTKNDFK